MLKFSAIELIDPKKSNLPQAEATNETLKVVLNDIFIVLGAIALLMVVVAGTRYIWARGNPETTKAARNMIIYGLVGVVLAALASTIVNVVLGQAG